MKTRAIVSPGSARIVHVQSALLPYSKGKWGLEIIPLCPRKVPPQASSAGNRVSWSDIAEMRKAEHQKRISPNQIKALKAPSFSSGCVLLHAIKRQRCWECKIQSGQPVSPGKCQLIPHHTLTRDLFSLILNPPTDRASGGSQPNASHCQHAISSHVFARASCSTPISWWGSSVVFSIFPPICVASQAGGKTPGIQWPRKDLQVCENCHSGERGWVPTQIDLSTFISDRNTPRVGTTELWVQAWYLTEI